MFHSTTCLQVSGTPSRATAEARVVEASKGVSLLSPADSLRTIMKKINHWSVNFRVLTSNGQAYKMVRVAKPHHKLGHKNKFESGESTIFATDGAEINDARGELIIPSGSTIQVSYALFLPPTDSTHWRLKYDGLTIGLLWHAISGWTSK
jgi:hypothetical protein